MPKQLPYNTTTLQDPGNEAKPVPIVKTCVLPCKGKTPCIRLCNDCSPVTTKDHWIEEINGKKNYKVEVKDKKEYVMNCLKLKDHPAKTFYGNSTGTSCFLEYVKIPFN